MLVRRRSLITLSAVAGLVAAMALAACGGKSSNSSSTPTATATPAIQAADATYVHQVCSAVQTFVDGAQSAVVGRTPAAGSGNGGVASEIQPLADSLVKSLQAATPPPDLKDYHQSLVNATSSAATNLGALIGQFGGAFGGPPGNRSPRPNFTPPANRTPRPSRTPRAGGRGVGGILGFLGLPQPPQQAQARLQQVAAADPTCQAIGFDFNFSPPGG